jgi:hypothetical protein
VTAASDPATARRLLRETLQRAVSCLTPSVLTEQTYGVASELSLNTRLSSSSSQGRLTLSLWHYYALVSDASRDPRARWQVQTTGYSYRLEDTDEREILAYHWHPAGQSHVRTPHLHLGAGAGALRRELQKAHLATGLVTPVAVLRLLIESFEVRARRADWADVLERADAAHSEP